MPRTPTGRAFGIRRLVRDLPEPDRSRLEARIAAIAQRYDEMSATYQDSKAENDIPLN